MFGSQVMVGNSVYIHVDLVISRKGVRRESEQLQNEENAHQPQRDEIREVPPLVEESPETHLDHRDALRTKHNLHVSRPQSTVPALPDRHAPCQSIDGAISTVLLPHPCRIQPIQAGGWRLTRRSFSARASRLIWFSRRTAEARSGTSSDQARTSGRRPRV